MKIFRQILLAVIALSLLAFTVLQIVRTPIGNNSLTNALAGRNTLHAANDDKYEALQNFISVMELVDSHYVDNLTDEQAINGAIKGMLQNLDPHSSYYTPEEFKSFRESTAGAFGGLGITISQKNDAIMVINAIEDTPAWKAGIQGGDIIAMIDKEPTTGLTIDAAAKKMRGTPGTKVHLTIVRKGVEKPLEITLKRAIIKIKSVKYDMIDNKTGYIRLSQFQEKSYEEMANALSALKKRGAKGLVLDLRNNGGGLLSEVIDITGLFVEPGKTVVSTRSRDGNDIPYRTKSSATADFKIPLVMLVNEWSASASEILAGALQDYKRAIIVGKTTFGKGSVQTIIPTRNQSAVKLTTSRYYTPNARSIQGVGIMPDIEVNPGEIQYNSDYYVIKEKDLDKHLVGENEKKKQEDKSIEEAIANEKTVLPKSSDLQYISAVQILKGIMQYGTK